MRTTEVPPSRIPPDRPTAPPRPVKPAPAPVAAATGSYRIQLGAFRDRANAEKLWHSVAGKLGGGVQPAYVAAGTVTRLQATGFASAATAKAACARAGGGCIVIAP